MTVIITLLKNSKIISYSTYSRVRYSLPTLYWTLGNNSVVRTDDLLAQHHNWDNTTFILFHHAFVFVMPLPNAVASTQHRRWGWSSPLSHPRCRCCGGKCAVGMKMASCGSSCDNDWGRVRVHSGTIYASDEFWWWMTSIARLVCHPPALFLVLQCNKYIDQGETIWTMGMSNFWPLKQFGWFFVRWWFPPFSEYLISILTVFLPNKKRVK